MISGSSAFENTPAEKQTTVENGPAARSEPHLEESKAKSGSFESAEMKDLSSVEKSEIEENKRKYNIQTFQLSQKRLAEIKSERKELRAKLD